MLHIGLMILKIIGIILLVILGLALFLLLTVLLVPVRYRGAGSWHEKPEGQIKVTWLLHILSVQASYLETLELSVRIFGIRILKKRLGGEEEEPDEVFSEETKRPDSEDDFQVSMQEIPENDVKAVSEPVDFRTEPENSVKASQQTFEASLHEKAEEEPQKETKKKETKKAAGLKKLLSKGKRKLLSVWKGLKSKLLWLKSKVKDGKELYEKVSGFLSQEANQNTIRLVKKQIYRILRHLFPRRIKGNITFGLEDPYTMGQVVSAAAFLYPLLKEQVVFTPVFDEKIIDGELELRGRIRIGTLLCLAGRVLIDTNFRTIVKKFLNRGGKKDGR